MDKTITRLLAFFIFFSSFASQGQTCGKRGSNTSLPGWVKSGQEALRSDTTDVLHYHINLDFTQIASTLLTASCNVEHRVLENTDGLSLDLLSMTIDSVTVDGQLTTYSYNDTLLRVHYPTTPTVGDTLEAMVYYHGTPQQDPSGFGGFYFMSGYYFNLGVAFQSIPHNYGRVWHPCFDNFVERASYSFEVLTNNGNTAYCNGSRLSQTTVGTDSLLTVWDLNSEIPSYLASVAVSNYTHAELEYISPVTGDTTPVWLIAQAGDTVNFKSSFTAILQNIQWFEELFGPHQYEKVGFVLVPFASGAMEHATNIAYPRLAANGTLLFQTLMAHELSHHWWGDWVTTERAEEMWINEGIASYCESLFLEQFYGRDDYDDNILENHYDVLRYAHQNDSGHFAIDAVPLNVTYGDHSYRKGADMMHTLRGYIGDDTLFFNAMKAVYQQYGNSHINSTEFRDGMNSVNGVDVTDFFADWVSKPGYPHFQIDNLTVTPDAGSYIVSVSIRQGLRDRSTYANNVPLTLSFIDSSWNEQQEVVMLNAYQQSFQFTLPFHPAEVMLDRHALISDATTSMERIIDTPGNINLESANIRLIVNGVADSALVRATHHWVGADDWSGVPQGIWLSTERYWELEGVWDTATFDMDGRFEFNGQNNAVGDIDADFLIDLPGQPFIEDSLVLLYREAANDPWTIWTDYLLNTAGSNTNKFGFFVAAALKKGQYAFGYRTVFASVPELSEGVPSLTIYPNPVQDQFQVDTEGMAGMLQVHDLIGKLIVEVPVQHNLTELSAADWPSGLYVITVRDGGLLAAAGKVVVD